VDDFMPLPLGCRLGREELGLGLGLGLFAPLCSGLHSTFELDVSTFCGVGWVVSVTETAQVALSSGRV